MPKEQPCLSKHSLCATSSKNAKDKSNSMTLLAIRNTEDAVDSSGRGSSCSSEKDSGYSDSSDWQQTVVEDWRSNKSRFRANEHVETSRPGHTQELRQENPENPTLMPAGRDLSPVNIINNVVLKQSLSHQPDMIQKRVQVPRRSGSRESGRSGAAHMILLRQPSLLLATLQLHKPSSQTPSTTGKIINGTHRPTVKYYPRIAPHPSRKQPDKSSSNDESQNQSKRVCTKHKSDTTPVRRSVPEQHLYKQPKLAVLTSGLPCSSSTRRSLSSSSPTTVSSSQGSLSGSSVCSTSSFLSTRGLHRNGSSSSRHLRFLNTVEILRQSDLLDIALRTKELLRQSNATERDIAQLRQHTELLCQAAGDPSPNTVAAWEHLHRSMAESGNYPDLKILQNLQSLHRPDSASQTENVAHGTPPGQDRNLEAGCKSSEKVTFMPPDSSTG